MLTKKETDIHYKKLLEEIGMGDIQFNSNEDRVKTILEVEYRLNEADQSIWIRAIPQHEQ